MCDFINGHNDEQVETTRDLESILASLRVNMNNDRTTPQGHSVQGLTTSPSSNVGTDRILDVETTMEPQDNEMPDLLTEAGALTSETRNQNAPAPLIYQSQLPIRQTSGGSTDNARIRNLEEENSVLRSELERMRSEREHLRSLCKQLQQQVQQSQSEQNQNVRVMVLTRDPPLATPQGQQQVQFDVVSPNTRDPINRPESQSPSICVNAQPQFLPGISSPASVSPAQQQLANAGTPISSQPAQFSSLNSTPVQFPPPQSIQVAGAEGTDRGRNICRHWAANRCTYGNDCRFAHPDMDSKIMFQLRQQVENRPRARMGPGLSSIMEGRSKYNNYGLNQQQIELPQGSLPPALPLTLSPLQ